MAAFDSKELLEKYESLSAEQKQAVSDFLSKHSARSTAPGQMPGGRRRKDRTHLVSGRLVFDDGNTDPPKPLHNMIVQLWDRDFGPDDELGSTTSDRDGNFEISYDPKDAGWKDLPDLQLRVFDTDHQYNRDGEVELKLRLVFLWDGPDDVTDQHFDFGELRIPYWTYEVDVADIDGDGVADVPIPRVRVVENGSPPQSWPAGRAIMLVTKAANVELRKRLQLFRNKISPLTLEDVQDAYPASMTMFRERDNPGSTRSDEFFGERILNGMSASVLDKDPANLDRYWLHHHWNSYEQDGKHAMPNVDMFFEVRDDKLLPVEIRLQFRAKGATEANAPIVDEHVVTAADGDKWLQAKRIARVSAALYAELDTHLVHTHLNTEQYAIAAYRNLRRSPIRYLLFPHLREVILINIDADKRLLGERGFITRATAFTADGLLLRVRQSLGMLDWKNWQPRPAICKDHKFAQAAKLFWDMLTDYVDDYFEQHQDEIKAHWYEVRRFSEDLVEHSVPLFLCKYLQGHHDENAGNETAPLGDWFQRSERIDLSVPRVTIDGIDRTVQPITTSDECDDESWANMKQVCRYVIHHATFMHTWSNSRQHDDGGELVYNGLGLRWGDNGVFVPESDHSICPPADQCTEQLWFAWLLSNASYGFVMKNEDRDINPALIKALRQRKEAFQECGVDIKTIQSRTNI